MKYKVKLVNYINGSNPIQSIFLNPEFIKLLKKEYKDNKGKNYYIPDHDIHKITLDVTKDGIKAGIDKFE